MYQIDLQVESRPLRQEEDRDDDTLIRLTDVTSGGTALPSAWNMLEDTNTTPDATKLQATMCRYSTPTGRPRDRS